MKQIIILGFILIGFKNVFASSKFQLIGEISKKLDVKVRITHGKINNEELSITDHRFVYFYESTDLYTPVHLTFENLKSNRKYYLTFLVTRESKIEIIVYRLDSLDFGKGVSFYGLPFQQVEDAFRESVLPIRATFNKYYESGLQKIRNGDLSQGERDSIKLLMNLEKVRYLEKINDFIISNKQSYYSLFLFKTILLLPAYSYSFGRERVKKTFDYFDETLLKTPLGEEIRREFTLKKSLEPGQGSPDFSFVSDKNIDFTLKSLLQEKDVLVVFTAEYCGACIKQIPIVKSIFDSKAGKIHLVYISLDRTEIEWKRSLKKRKYPGINTADLPGYNKGYKISEIFDIQLIPQIILIDSNWLIRYNNIIQKDDEQLTLLKTTLHLD